MMDRQEKNRHWKNSEVKKRLKQIARNEIVLDEKKKSDRIEALVQTKVQVPQKGNFSGFVLSQMGFINKNVLFWQGLWIVFFSCFVWKSKKMFLANEIVWILSAAPPLLLLLTIEEVARVYNRSMLEIEYATKYSLKKVVMVRMLLLSAANGIILGSGIIFAKYQMGLKLAETFLYSLTPLLLMTFLLLLCMKRWKGDQLMYAAVSIYIVLILVLLMGQIGQLNLYSTSSFFIWGLLFAGGLTAAVCQFIHTMKYLKHFEIIMGG